MDSNLKDGAIKKVSWYKLNPEKAKEYQRKYYERNKERKKDYQRQYQLDNKDSLKSKRQSYRSNNKLKFRDSFRKSVYGITPEEYQVLLETQGGRCALCPSKTGRRGNQPLAVDHCHKTGKIRGLLCMPCNAKLATIENEKFVFLAKMYLDYWNSK